MYKALTLVIGFGLAMPSAAATLVEVATSALANHPQVQIANLAINMDQQQALIQRTGFKPQVGLSTSLSMQVHGDSGSTGAQQYLSLTEQLTVSQKLYDATARVVQTSLDLQVEKSSLEALETQSMVLLDVTERYVQAAMAIEKMHLQQQEESYTQQLLKSVNHKYQLQEAYITDVHMAQANYDLAAADTLVAASEVDAALANLSEITGTKIPLFKPGKQLTSAVTKLSLGHWVRQALESNHAVQASQVASRIALKTLDAHQYANFPVIDAKLTFKDQANRGSSNVLASTSGRSFAISLTMPIYQGGRVAAQRQYSKDNYDIALQQQQKVVQELTNRVTAQYLREQAMNKRIVAIERALESTQKATETIRTGLTYGVSTQTQLLASTKQEFHLQLQLKQAKYQATLSWVQLKQMAGQLTLEYLEQLSQQFDTTGNGV